MLFSLKESKIFFLFLVDSASFVIQLDNTEALSNQEENCLNSVTKHT